MATCGPRRRRLLRKAPHRDCRHGFAPAQYVTTMSRRPPRNFRQRQADSGSSSDPDSDPGPRSDSGLGRAAKRALGAPRNRGRARVWATSRREGPSRPGRGPPDVSGAGEGSPTSPEADGDSPEPDAPGEDAEAGTRDLWASAGDLDPCGEAASEERSGSLADPTRAPAAPRRLRSAAEDYLPLSGGPRDPPWGASDTDSEEEPAPGAAEIPGSDSGSEEAQDAWEAQQMRKALRAPDPVRAGPSPGGEGARAAPSSWDPGRTPFSPLQGAEPGPPHDRPPGKRAWEPPLSLPPVSLAVIKKQLNRRLASLEGVHRSHQREYERRLQDVVSAKTAIADLEKAPDPAPSCAFYRAMKAYLVALVDCLREKIGAIQELESTMHSLLREHAAAFWKRRQAELHSEAVRLQQLAASMTDDAPAPDGLTEGVGAQDVLGEPAVWRMQKTQATESSGTSRHQEGASSSDDEDSGSEGADIQERRGAILQNCQSVFEDVNEEFSDVQKILLKFQQWREQFPDSYYEAYASLCLPKLLSPFIRIQMMDWNPLKPDCVSLRRMPWFQSLEDFANSGAVARRDSPDREILPAALEKTVLPHITGFVRFLWDPLSAPQTRSLVERCREVLSLCPPPRGRKGHAIQELRDLVVSRLKKAVEDDVFIPLYPKRVLENRDSPHSRFQERRFRSAVKVRGPRPRPPGGVGGPWGPAPKLGGACWPGGLGVGAGEGVATQASCGPLPAPGQRGPVGGPGPGGRPAGAGAGQAAESLPGHRPLQHLPWAGAGRQVPPGGGEPPPELAQWGPRGVPHSPGGQPGPGAGAGGPAAARPRAWVSARALGVLWGGGTRVCPAETLSPPRAEVREMVLLLVEMKAAAQARAFVERNGLEQLRSCLNGPR
ncbi:intron Large complex component GCFC2 isoform X3 [Sminthopsis crassicaudata]|uniref:intron Large complex component GCFC2 isoform X3 n=1 Tax=Sminthopsis crassicaudata TaxID=9301 RepID=UPI003D683F2E